MTVVTWAVCYRLRTRRGHDNNDLGAVGERPQESWSNLSQPGWTPTSELNAHLSNWGVVPPKKQKSKHKWWWPNMMGQGLCDGNVIVNLYGQLRLWYLDALQFLKYPLGFYVCFPPQIIATEQEGLISTPKWTEMKRKTSRLSWKHRHFFTQKSLSHTANISYLTSKNWKHQREQSRCETIMFKL